MRNAPALAILCGCALLGLISATPTRSADAPQSFHVAPGGDDTAPGTEAHPFATLERARAAMREWRAETTRATAVTVYLRDGVHFINEPLRLGPEDGGSVGAPVTWAAYPGETPIISGGERIIGWQPEADGMWTAEVTGVRDGNRFFRQLFIRGSGQDTYERRYRPSMGFFVIAGLTDAPHRYPDRPINHRNPQNEFHFHDGDIREWENLADVDLIAMHDWSSGRLQIEQIDFTKRIVRFTDFPHYRIGHWYPGGRNPYLVENVKEVLGSPGEWYLDRPTGMLSYRPVDGEYMPAAEVIAPRLEQLLVITGEMGHPVSHVVFRGIAFAHTAWHKPPHRYAEDYGRACRQGFVDMPSAIELKWAEDCTFDRCTIAHVGSYGLDFGEGCHRNSIVGSRIFDCGTGGVKVGVVNSSVQEPALPTGNAIENNLISDTGIVHYSGHGIWVGYAAGTAIRHNEVQRSLYSAVAVGWSHSTDTTPCRDSLIEYNHIHDVMLLLDHGGAMYTLGYQPGMVLRGNLIHDTYQTWLHGNVPRSEWAGGALGFDDGSSGFLIEDNVIFNTPARPELPVEAQADRHTVGRNYFGIAPGEEGYPAELAARAGPEPEYVGFLVATPPVPTPPVLSMQLPERVIPMRIAEDFDRLPVGSPPTLGRARLEDKQPGMGTDALVVTDATAASGRHSLLIQDAPNLSRTWLPYLSYSPGYDAGTARISFHIRMEEGAMLEFACRGRHPQREFVVGPQIMFYQGGVHLRDRMLMEMGIGQWYGIEVGCRLGVAEPGIGEAGLAGHGTWALTVVRPDGSREAFDGLRFVDTEFVDISGVYFISTADEAVRCYLDTIEISCE